MSEQDSGASLIQWERERQVSDEGWTPEHDDEHNRGEMAIAAACYAMHASNGATFVDIGEYRAAPPPLQWPWDARWWKPKNPMRDLVRAGALCAAEHDRVMRAAMRRYAEPQSND